MTDLVKVITGGCYEDDRGMLYHYNDFDMQAVKRSYVMIFPSTNIIRGWRAHKIEQRWFSCINGGVTIRIVKIDNWDLPQKNSPIIEYNLNSNTPEILHVPAGHGTAIQGRSSNAAIIAYGDYHIEHASNDNYTYTIDYFNNTK